MARTHRWTATNRLDILKGIASGLESMHAAGIAHLDIKPANVLIQPECPMEAESVITG